MTTRMFVMTLSMMLIMMSLSTCEITRMRATLEQIEVNTR